MGPGSLIGKRFVVSKLLEQDSLSEVFRAQDQTTGQWVAAKVVRDAKRGQVRDRFFRECELLAKLQHPGIVEYVAHGADGESLWFAVGLPEGETLQARFARSKLTVDECRELGIALARALGAAHAVGVVHRDLKPQNIFLAGKSISSPKVFDFGVASVVGATTLTNAAELLGTPAYMAPELAKGTNVTGAADVYSIGAVLFEGLTGRPPFGSGPPLAVMAKLLLDDAPPILTVRDDIPKSFAELVDRMLAKDFKARFQDGAALAEALSGLAPSPMPPQVATSTETPAPKKTEVARPLGASPAKLAMRERQLLSVLLVGKPPSGEIPLPSDGPTIATPMGSSPLDVVYGEVLKRGGWAERLVDGTIVISLPGEAATVDQAASAARCAWAVRRVMPGVPIALATGRTDGSEGFPVGEVIERGVSLLEAAASAGELTGTGVFVDELTAGLLDRRFMIRADKGNFWLVGEGEPRGAGRSIGGQTSPFVGRKLELDQLVQRYGEAVATKSCRITLVTGPPGMGKSRLRHELMTTLEAKHPTPTVLLGRGDPSRSSAALSLVAAAFSDLFGLREGEGEEVARHRVRARVSRNVPRQDRDRVAAFLGELVGVRFAESTHPPLAEARADRTRMADQTRTACQDFFAAELSRGPLVLVLDDLHAADAPSVMFLDFVLRVFGESPLFVVGLARSEIVDRFPTDWGGKPVEMLPLAPLSSQAAQLLAEQILGDADERIPAVVERAQGNVFFLEELLRSILEGRGDSLPETLYAAIDAQLGALPPFARRVLRCASVFGERFSLIGVRAILLEGSDSDVRSVLATLVDRELIRPTVSTADAGAAAAEFVFASEIIRGACYEELTEIDRKAAHRLAGEWLESIAKPDDASELARHFSAAGDTRRSAMWLVRAAQIALEVGDFGQAAEATERAAKAGAVGLLLARARLLQSEAARYTGESRAMFEHASEAMQLLPPRTPAWWTAAADSLAGAVQLAQSARIDELAKEMVESPNMPPVESARAAVHLLHVGRRAEADKILERVAAAKTLRGWGHRALAFRAMYRGDIGEHLAQREQAVRDFVGAGDVREAAAELVSLGFIRHELGLYTEAEESLRESLAIAERLDLRAVIADARERLGNVLMRLGLTSEAETFLKSSLDRVTRQGNRRLEGRCRRQLGLLYLDRRALDPAMEEIMHASQLLSVFPPLLPTALAACARVLLAHGARDEALFMASDAMEALKRVKTVDEGEAFTLLTHAETLHAAGKTAEATEAIKAARVRLLARAGTLDPKRAKTFLEEVSENHRTIELAKEWLNELPPPPPPPPPEAPKPPPKPDAPKPEPKPERHVIRQDTPFVNENKPPAAKPKLVLRAVSPVAPPSRPAGFLVSGSPERIELMAAALKELRADVYRAKTSAEMFKQLDAMTTTPTKLVVFVDPLADGVDSSTFAGLVRAHERGKNCQLVIASAGVAAKMRSTVRSWGADGFVPLTGKGPEVAEAMRPFFEASK